ncbi:hypothetical protein ACFLY4_06490 [Chloroflexota bacterium]
MTAGRSKSILRMGGGGWGKDGGRPRPRGDTLSGGVRNRRRGDPGIDTGSAGGVESWVKIYPRITLIFL